MIVELPECVVWLQALGPAITGIATVIIAAIVAWITFRQSLTAREKLVLDLFKDRIAVLNEVDAALRPIIGAGNVEGSEPFRLLHEARGKARFLFGPEVEEHIKSLIHDAARLRLANTKLDAGNEDDDWAQVIFDTSMRISEGTDKLATLMDPYTKFAQRLPGR